MFCCAAPAPQAHENVDDKIESRPSSPQAKESSPPSSPKAKPSNFKATFQKESGATGIGLDMDVMEGAFIRIHAVHPNGPAWGYNRGLPEDEQIKAGDYLLSVNGVQGSGEVLEKELHSQRTVTLEISRPLEWEVELEKKNGQSWGMSLKSAEEYTLVVAGVSHGGASEWNVKHPDQSIRGGDRILSVSGQSPKDMQAQFENSNKVTCVVSRPPLAEEDNQTTFMAKFENASTGIGMHLDILEGACIRIHDVHPNGPAWGFNRGRPQEEHIKTGDYITSVNGVRGEGAVLEKEIHSQKQVTLEISRPVEWEVTLQKTNPSDSFGMSLNSAEEKTLAVHALAHGVVSDFNKSHPSKAIRTGDRILSIVGNAPQDMMAQIKSSDKIKCLMSRPPHN